MWRTCIADGLSSSCRLLKASSLDRVYRDIQDLLLDKKGKLFYVEKWSGEVTMLNHISIS
ncbi:MAG: hypothetical protein QXY40_08005 [Candidatus Methanomethylicia archaeon]